MSQSGPQNTQNAPPKNRSKIVRKKRAGGSGGAAPRGRGGTAASRAGGARGGRPLLSKLQILLL